MQALIEVLNAERDGRGLSDRLVMRQIASLYEKVLQVGEAVSFTAAPTEEFCAYLRSAGNANFVPGGDTDIVVAGLPANHANGGGVYLPGAVYYREPVGVQSGFTTSFTVEYVVK